LSPFVTLPRFKLKEPGWRCQLWTGCRAMVEFRIQRRGLEKRWVIVKTAAGEEPVEVGLPYTDPELAMQNAKRLNEYARLVASHSKREPK
jgi:hypothetical protein